MKKVNRTQALNNTNLIKAEALEISEQIRGDARMYKSVKTGS